MNGSHADDRHHVPPHSHPEPQPDRPAGGNEVEKIVHTEPWYKKVWRPMLAVVYALIVVFDFVVMPIIVEQNNQRTTDDKAVELALKFTESSSQIQALKTFAETRKWEPLTLMGGGMFHIAFGALLTGAAVTRGLEKKEHANKGAFMN